MAIQMNITTEGLAKFRTALETGKLETLKTAKFYGGWSGGAVSGSVVATLNIAVNKAIESNSNVCRFICQDKSDAEYTTYGGEVIDADGVIVATFNNGGSPVSTKQSKAEMMLGFEIKFEDNTAASSVINMGDTTFVFDDATETAAGIIELATEAEAKEGTDAKRAITPKTLMAKLLEYLPLTGGKMTGTIRSALEGLIVGDTDTSAVRISGGTNWDSGASLVVYGKDHATYPGMFRIKAEDGTNEYGLLGKPDGTLTWDGSQALLPAGAVFAFAANTTPSGCLICNGAAVSRTTYARLFAAIGTTHGSGDGSTTFNLPNMGTQLISAITNTNIPVKGNGISLGVTNGETNASFASCPDGIPRLRGDTYGKNIGTTVNNLGTSFNGPIGLATDAAKSGVVANMTATKTTVRWCIKY